MTVKMRIIANLSPSLRPNGNQWQWKKKKIIENECTKNNGFEVIYFSFISSNKRGENGKKIWVPIRHRTTNLWIRRCEALPLKTLQWARPVLSYKFGDLFCYFMCTYQTFVRPTGDVNSYTAALFAKRLDYGLLSSEQCQNTVLLIRAAYSWSAMKCWRWQP